jgi:hypothetical protein
MEIYVVYRIGTMPHAMKIHNLGDLGAWRWGVVSRYEDLRDMVNLHPILIDENTAKGLALLNVTEIKVEGGNMNETRPLTNDEIALKEKGKMFVNKLNARGMIKGNIGDTNDIIADLTKIIAVMAEDLYQKGTLSESIRDVFTQYLSNYDVIGLPKKVKERFDKIGNILSDNYFVK